MTFLDGLLAGMPSFAATSFVRGGLSRSILVQQDTTVIPTDRQYVEVAVTVHIDHARTVVMLVPDIDEVRAPICPRPSTFSKTRRRALAGWARLCSPTTTSRSPSPSMSATSGLIGPTTLADRTCSQGNRIRTLQNLFPENLARLRRLALNLLRANPDKSSTRGKIKRAAWYDHFLLNILANA